MYYSDPFSTPLTTTPIVVFNLGGFTTWKPRGLWQYNQSRMASQCTGAAEIELSVSTDNTNYTTLTPTLFPTRAGGTNEEPASGFQHRRCGS